MTRVAVGTFEGIKVQINYTYHRDTDEVIVDSLEIPADEAWDLLRNDITDSILDVACRDAKE